MTSPRTRGALAALLAGAVACGGRTHAATSAAPATAGPPALSAVERARVDSARSPYTAADVHFMTAMIGHHSQAIVMAKMAPTHGASASIRTLAERIINAQQDEIVTMQNWLRDRGQPVPDPKAPMAMSMPMAGMDHEAPMLMPGMLTPAQMAHLDSARGPAFDQLFLTSMIQHHKGATSMVRSLFATYGAAQDEQVFKFASDVNVDQTTEIARMQRMLFAVETEGDAK
jgi:uncharacterized protein (DUF305 family)